MLILEPILKLKEIPLMKVSRALSARPLRSICAVRSSPASSAALVTKASIQGSTKTSCILSDQEFY
ncbi:MAG: hypothetical protein ACFE9S_16885 [Candidatus Hermodarchaeota archaeon]